MNEPIKIETKEQLTEAIATYEDMMAELQPLLWQRDELYEAIKTAVVNLKETVITNDFVYAYKTQKSTDHQEAVRLAGIPQAEIDAKTTVTLRFVKSDVDPEWLDALREAGLEPTESTAWSKLKTPKAIRDKVTTEGVARMSVGAKK